MRPPSKLILPPALVATALALAAGFAPCAFAAPAPAMSVAVHEVSGAASSYFTLTAKAGQPSRAGTIELRNRRDRRVVVRLDPVGALTASTLGSAYAVPARTASGSAKWITLPTRRVVLGPRERVVVPVSVALPSDVTAGDYLSGISVEALGQNRERRLRSNVAVSSVQRYAVGLLVQVPGPRHPRLRIPASSVEREPAALTFYLHASNTGNEILQNVRGRVLVTRGRRTVARIKIGPGTFVTGTSIAYPVLVPREQPAEGAVYRIRAFMRYHGGIARYDSKVKFGHAAAKAQQDFGGRPLTDGRIGIPTWMILLAAGLAALAALVIMLLLRRRRTPGPAAARRALQRALLQAASARQPLTLVRVFDRTRKTKARKLAAAARSRLRPTDRLYRIGKSELLVLMPVTHIDAARLVCSDLPLPLSRAAGPDRIDIKVIEANGLRAEVLLDRLREPRIDEWDDYDLPLDSLTRDTQTRS